MRVFVPLIVLSVLSDASPIYLRAIKCLDNKKCAVGIVDENYNKLPTEYPSEERCAELCRASMYAETKSVGEKKTPLILMFLTGNQQEKSSLDVANKAKTRRRGSDSSSEEDDSKESRGDRNPDNPYSTRDNKYKLNTVWNYQMSGNHLNLNPKAPSFGSMEPSPVKLFRGRKWWYFNQDDYLPMN
ncbi:uncharacterized protein LOC121729228 isoform X2 [Aricia agestis]|uniref:uncharacterized protein LOC121729228 isoform X2 n=1 Tax=Aricia agestis TaxID=91739 RepID=UPI001C206298|nr:uncharacterized protein LOC121729228 isoform X2 [Aricia agestis]